LWWGRYDDFIIFCIQVAEYLLDHQWMFIRHNPVQIVFPDDLSMFAITSYHRIAHRLLFLSQKPF
jgi:hypothetical protein